MNAKNSAERTPSERPGIPLGGMLEFLAVAPATAWAATYLLDDVVSFLGFLVIAAVIALFAALRGLRLVVFPLFWAVVGFALTIRLDADYMLFDPANLETTSLFGALGLAIVTRVLFSLGGARAPVPTLARKATVRSKDHRPTAAKAAAAIPDGLVGVIRWPKPRDLGGAVVHWGRLDRRR